MAGVVVPQNRAPRNKERFQKRIMTAFERAKNEMLAKPRRWLITGVAGFIGSNLLEAVLRLEQPAVGLDNLATGYRKNLDQVRARVSGAQWDRFQFIEGDISDPAVCRAAAAGVDFVLHQAALGSVPASMANPLGAHQSNVTGFLNVLAAARDARVKRLVYASSSAVYGDEPNLPKVEDKIGQPLSPYAATKLMDELYAGVFARAYGFESVGLRYFNVFGPRQDPEGAYAAVIPKWIAALLKQEPVAINGDGETTRDFCYVEDVVQANLLAATSTNAGSANQVYNVALGQRTSLNQLFEALQGALRRLEPKLPAQKPRYGEFRAGDVRHSLADISKAQQLLGFQPRWQIGEALDTAMEWYRTNAG
jgi:UDP-N-acetylglucosamine 4-epimerase